MAESTVDPRLRERVMQRALELQGRREAAREARRDADAFRDAAAEVGVDPDLLAQAEAEVSRQAAEARARTQRRVGIGLAAASGAVAVAIGVAWWTAPVEPWVEPMEAASAWRLDVNPGTVASVDFVEEGERGGVAVLTVERFQPDGSGEFRVNLDAEGVPGSLRGYETLSVDLAGDLPVARVYLEAGPNERWRSPPLAVTPQWGTHELSLRSFEHQERVDGRWRVVDPATPAGLSGLSVKVGHYMNAPEASGAVRIDAIELR